MTRPTVALIDRSALRANMALAQSLAPKTQIMEHLYNEKHISAYNLEELKKTINKNLRP